MEFFAKLLGTPHRKENTNSVGSPVPEKHEPEAVAPVKLDTSVDASAAPSPPHPESLHVIAAKSPSVPNSPTLSEPKSAVTCSSSDSLDSAISAEEHSITDTHSTSNQSYGTANQGAFSTPEESAAGSFTKPDTDSDGVDFESADEQSLASYSATNVVPITQETLTEESQELSDQSFGLSSVINKLGEFSIASPAANKIVRDFNSNPLTDICSSSEDTQDNLDDSCVSSISTLSTKACHGSVASESLNSTTLIDEPSFSALNFLAAAALQTATKASESGPELNTSENFQVKNQNSNDKQEQVKLDVPTPAESSSDISPNVSLNNSNTEHSINSTQQEIFLCESSTTTDCKEETSGQHNNITEQNFTLDSHQDISPFTELPKVEDKEHIAESDIPSKTSTTEQNFTLDSQLETCPLSDTVKEKEHITDNSNSTSKEPEDFEAHVIEDLGTNPPLEKGVDAINIITDTSPINQAEVSASNIVSGTDQDEQCSLQQQNAELNSSLSLECVSNTTQEITSETNVADVEVLTSNEHSITEHDTPVKPAEKSNSSVIESPSVISVSDSSSPKTVDLSPPVIKSSDYSFEESENNTECYSPSEIVCIKEQTKAIFESTSTDSPNCQSKIGLSTDDLSEEIETNEIFNNVGNLSVVLEESIILEESQEAITENLNQSSENCANLESDTNQGINNKLTESEQLINTYEIIEKVDISEDQEVLNKSTPNNTEAIESIEDSLTQVKVKLDFVASDDAPAGGLTELLDICQKQEQELSEDISIDDLLAAEAELVCQEIHNASLQFSDTEEENELLLRKSASPINISTNDPFKLQTKMSSSPNTVSVDSAVSSKEHAGLEKNSESHKSNHDSEAEVNHSEAGPDTAEEQFVSSDIFKDPNAFDFLSRLGGGSAMAATRLERESLYVKFDPLVGSQEHRKVFLSPCLENSQGENKTPEPSPVKPRSNLTLSEADTKNDNSESSVGTLIALNSPAALKQGTPTGKAKPSGDDTPDMHQVAFAQELLERQRNAFEERLRAQNEEHKKEMDLLQAQLEKALSSANHHAQEKADSNKNFSLVMREYEDTISKMLTDHDNKCKAWAVERERLEREQKQAQDDLSGAELAFSDLHRKYERAKDAIVGLKSNEEALRKSNADFQASIERTTQNYQKLKAHAESQLEKANEEIDQLLSAKEVDQAAHDANVKRLKLQISSLEQSMEVLQREKQELVSICDDLLAKIGQNKS